MKIKTEIEITPEEVRAMLGMPEYSWLQETYSNSAKVYPAFDQVAEWQRKYNPLFKEKNTC